MKQTSYDPFSLCLLMAAVGCGTQGRMSNRSNGAKDGDQSLDATVEEGIRACKLPTAISLQQAVTYSGNLFPIMQDDCAECHKPSIESRQNSTNCHYVRDHLDQVIKRLKNARDGAAFKAANPAATNDEVNSRYPRNERPMPPVGKTPLPEAEIALFEAWRSSPNPCGEADQVLEDAAPEVPKNYSSDDEESSVQNLNKVFATASCEDGPEVNVNENWDLFTEILKPTPSSGGDPLSVEGKGVKFYDYFAKKYLSNVNLVTEGCTMDGLIGGFAAVSSFRDALAKHAAYGWRVLQCGGEVGKDGQIWPRITIGSLARITTSLGDFTYGVSIKNVRITVNQEKAPEPSPASASQVPPAINTVAKP